MPIDLDFPKNHQVIGKHKQPDGEHYHFVWGPGKAAEAAEKEEVKAAYTARGEELVPLGIHGTMIAVDWDPVLQMALVLKHVLFRSFNGIERSKMFRRYKWLMLQVKELEKIL